MRYHEKIREWGERTNKYPFEEFCWKGNRNKTVASGGSETE